MDEVTLSRELRFGLHEHREPEESTNGFAGKPALQGIAPFLTLTARISGQIDPATGMLVNIKHVDRILRDVGVPTARAYYYADASNKPLGGADLVGELFGRLAARFSPHRLEAVELALSPYLKLCVSRKEPAVVQMTERFEFSAAHRLHSDALSPQENQETFGRCNNPNGHGHNYELEVTVAGEPDARTGVVIAVGALQKIVNTRVVDVFDHKHLNLDCPEFRGMNPTVENIARVIHGKLVDAMPAGVRLTRVRVWETPKTWCAYPAE